MIQCASHNRLDHIGCMTLEDSHLITLGFLYILMFVDFDMRVLVYSTPMCLFELETEPSF
jgi:hypothetical protein